MELRNVFRAAVLRGVRFFGVTQRRAKTEPFAGNRRELADSLNGRLRVHCYDSGMKFILAVLAGVTLYGQTFEVASIRPSAARGTEGVDVGVHLDRSQLRCSQLALKDYLTVAYRVKIYQISGPDWIGSERFDISAKLPAGAKSDEVPEMMQALLVERFELKTHKEKKEFPVYALTVAKGGLKAKPTPPDAQPQTEDAPKPAVNVTGGGGPRGVNINMGNGSSFSLADNKFVARKLTMAQLADTLARFEDRPVVDMTGAEGAYDLELEFTPEDYQAMMIRSAVAAGVTLPPEALKLMDSSGDSLLRALAKAGLKLEPRKAPLDVVVIDHMSKTPTEN